MAPITAARIAKERAVYRLKRAIKELEQYIPPDRDQEELSAIVEPAARAEASDAEDCQECADEVQDLDADAQARHQCTHQGGGDGTGQGQAGPSKPLPRRGGRWSRAKPGVIKQYIEAVEEQVRGLENVTADLTALLSNAEMRREETHKDEWLDYYMAIKNRALEVIEDLEQAQQVNADRDYALQVAREQRRVDDITVEEPHATAPPAPGGGEATPATTQPVPSGVPAIAPPAPRGGTTVQRGNQNVNIPDVVSGEASTGDVNLDYAKQILNSLAATVERNIKTIEGEVEQMGDVAEEINITECKELCRRAEHRIMHDLANAGKEVAKLDINKETNVLTCLRGWQEARMSRVEEVESKLRKMRGSSVRSNQNSVSSGSSEGSSQSYKAFMKKLDPPTFSGKVEDWPEFRSVWKELLAGHPDSVQVQYLRKSIPANDARRIAGVKTMGEAWKRLEDVHGNLQLNIITVKTNLETFMPKAVERYKKVQEVYEAVEKAVTQLSNLGALHYLKEDFSLMNRIVLKLSEEDQTQYSEYISSDEMMMDMSSTWDKFWLWMEKIHKRAVTQGLMHMCGASNARSGGGKTLNPGARSGSCHTCGGMGHMARDCPSKLKPSGGGPAMRANHATTSKVHQWTQAEYDQNIAERKRNAKPCPICGKRHLFKKRFSFGKADWPSVRLESCDVFLAKTPNERGKEVEKHKACYKCTHLYHQGDVCKTTFTCNEKSAGKECGKAHHTTLHNTGVTYCNKTLVKAVGKARKKGRKQNKVASTELPDINAPVLLEVQNIDVHGVDAKVMWDGGSTGALVTHSYAERAGMKGEMVNYWLVVVGHPRIMKQTMLYTFQMEDNQGRRHDVQAYGIDDITEDAVKVDLNGVKSVFPEAPDEVYSRPEGRIDILIGSMYKNIQPYGGDDEFTRGRLRLVKSIFGCGFILTGTHPAITTSEYMLCNNAKLMANHALLVGGSELGVGECGSLRCSPHSPVSDHPASMGEVPGDKNLQVMMCNRAVATLKIPEFFEAEEMGISAVKACKRCRGCRDCSYRGMMISREEEEVVKRVEESIKYDEKNQRVSVSYPWTEDVCKLTDNVKQAIGCQKSLEDRLSKNGEMKFYNEELKKFWDRGAIVNLSREEIESYEATGGPVNYVSHHGVHNPGSATTPLRVVTNSSLKNKNANLSPNDCMQKGPNALSSLLEVIIGFRMYEVGLTYDMTKAYQSISTGDVEKHVRRIVWRWGDRSAQWEIMAYAVVTFGDQIAGLILELVKKMAAELGKEVDEEACHQISNKTYVDDGLGGGSREQVERFRGKLVNGSYDGTLPRILAKVGLKLKVMIASGDSDQERIALMGDKLLGHFWKPGEDKFIFKMVVNLSNNKTKGQKSERDLTEEDIPRLPTRKLTKRILVGLVMSQYDPMGILSPITIILKIKLRNLYGPDVDLNWDEEIPRAAHEEWVEIITNLLRVGEIEVARAVRPEGMKDPPELIGFADGSLLAYACAIYIRWTKIKSNPDDPDRYVVKLVCAKARVTAVRGTTAPRSEMCGFLILTRLLKVVVSAMDVKPSKVTIALDSQCTISAIEKSGGLLAPYFASRTSESMANLDEIREHTEVPPVQHVPGSLNPADIPTRDKTEPSEVREGGVWQDGPHYLSLPREQWPFSREFRDIVPEQELRKPKAVFNAVSTLGGSVPALIEGIIFKMVERVMESSTHWQKTVFATARMLKGIICQDREKIRSGLTVRNIKVARAMQFVVSMGPTFKALESEQLTALRPTVENGIVYTVGRVDEALPRLLGVLKLPILMRSTRLATLIMWEAHNEDHRSSSRDVLARARQRAWIIRGRYLAKLVCKTCPLCRLNKMKLAKQLMGKIPEHQLQPCPPFTFISLDFAGPYQARAMGNSRAHIKLWGLVLICQNTRAIKMYATAGYSTDDFLTAYHRFTANHGNPVLVVSDAGTQLRKAGQVIEKGDPASLDWNKIVQGAAKNGTEWKCIEPGCQWRNGLAEAAVKLVKSTLALTLASQASLNYAELDTLFSSVANIVNQRPIGLRSQNEEDLHAITPNDLLLQRTKNTVPGLTYSEDTSFTKRQEAMKELEDTWWNQWIVQVLPHLVPYKKWKTEYRALQVGDVVLVLYDKKVGKGSYKLGRVTAVHPDAHGVVRTVTVGMRRMDKREPSLPYKSVPLTEIKLGVQRVAVICPVDEQGEQGVQEEQGEGEQGRAVVSELCGGANSDPGLEVE